jgi:uncharacterized integral membrane protein
MDPDQDVLPEQQNVQPPARRRDQARLTAGLILGGLGLVFALINLGDVKVDWIVGSAHSPLILVIVVSVLIGIGIDRVVVRRARKRAKPPDGQSG